MQEKVTCWSEELTAYAYAGYVCQLFKPTLDKRYHQDQKIASHNSLTLDAVPVNNSQAIKTLIKKETEVIGIDEVQFFDAGIVALVDELANQNYIVIVAGLDKDFRNQAFLNIKEFFIKAENIFKLHAICNVCGGMADRTQRIINNQPASISGPLIMIGSQEKYEARCRFHHELTT